MYCDLGPVGMGRVEVGGPGLFVPKNSLVYIEFIDAKKSKYAMAFGLDK